jgi:PKD repeat protein
MPRGLDTCRACACSGSDHVFTTPAVATTGAAIPEGVNAATIRGTVNPRGLETVYHFEYDTTEYKEGEGAHGTSVPIPDKSAGAGTNDTVVSQTIEGLKPRTPYHYRLVAANAEGTFRGADAVIGTTPPAATTGTASDINAVHATLHATVNPEGLPTTYRFTYRTGCCSEWTVPASAKAIGSGTEDIEVSAAIGPLEPSQTYHFRVIAGNVAGATYGEEETFTSGGAEWGVQPLPQPAESSEEREAYGVSCASVSDCIAVGSHFALDLHASVTLAEAWDGQAWSAMATPNPPGLQEGWKNQRHATLSGVSCVSAGDCVAVGDYKGPSEVVEPLAERWDGSKWTVQATKDPSGAQAANLFFGLSCPATTACTAVGTHVEKAGSSTLAERWDGSEWSVQPTPELIASKEAQLYGVDCVTSSACTAVGTRYVSEATEQATEHGYQPLGERWDGTSWSVLGVAPLPEPSEWWHESWLNAVSCAEANPCTAVGDSLSAPKGQSAYQIAFADQPQMPPFASFSVSTAAPTAGQPVSFDGSSSSDPGGTITGYSWDFGDGSHGSGATPTHTYAKAGSYTVTLTVTDAEGKSGEVSHLVKVADVPPSASFSVSTPSPTAGQPVSFDGSASSDPDGTISSYSWSFGDGASASGETPSHTYAKAGTYTVGLTVTDNAGLSASVEHEVKVVEAPPLASFSVSTPSPIAGQPVSFDGSTSSNPGGTITGYSWDFGDGSHGSGATPTHTYTKAGAYTVKLTVTDNAGLSASVEHTVTVADAPPGASFTVTTFSPTAASPVAFDGSTSSDPDGTIESYSWSFGDGATASGATTSHIYTKAGTYTVKLTVTDNAGLSASAEREVKVVEASPLASFVVSTPGLIAGQPVSFDGSASSDPGGTITGYSWDFGDGAHASGATPTHTYAKAGSYTVRLTVTDAEGKNGEMSHVVQVADVPPSAYFLVGTPSPTAGQPDGFDGSASSDPDGTISSYSWSFGDGGSASGATTSHTYAKAGTYTVKLTIIDDGARTSSVEHTIAVAEPSNTVRMVGVKRSRNGNVSLKLAVPGPGLLVIRQARASAGASARTRNDAKMLVKRANTAISRAGTVTLQIVLTPSGRTLLHRRRRLSVKLLITFMPTDGTPGSIERVLVLDAPHKSNTKLVWLARQALEDWVDVLRSTLLR